jgi:hypothetical protein
MIEATRALRVWLEANGIDPRKVQLTLSADPTTAESIGRAVSDIHDALVFGPPADSGLIRDGTFNDIRFRVADGQAQD